jgi:Putative transposase
VQRFGDALDLNPHFHTLVLDGAYVVRHGRFEGFVPIEPPSDEDIARVTEQVAQRIVRMLRHRGKLELDDVAAVEDDGSVLLPCMEASVQRVGVIGPAAGRALRRPGRRAHVELAAVAKRRCAEVDGFSLHADVCVPARDRAQLERLVRYVARPAIASERLELLADGRLRYRFKRAWRDGSVAVEYDPVDFIGKLAALVPRPRPRTNLVRHHGCLALHASIRAYVVKDGRGPPPSKAELIAMAAARASTQVGSHAALSCAPARPRFRWAELMRRVFEIDVLACPSCGGRMKPIAEITDRRLARRMLEHVGLPSEASQPWPARGPPEFVGSTCLDDDQRWPDEELGTRLEDAD